METRTSPRGRDVINQTWLSGREGRVVIEAPALEQGEFPEPQFDEHLAGETRTAARKPNSKPGGVCCEAVELKKVPRGEPAQVVANLAVAEVNAKVRFCRRGSARRLPCPIFECRARDKGLVGQTVSSDDPYMIATVPVAARPEISRVSLNYLLLGDLRLLLEEPASVPRDRWLVATLDMLLMSRPRSTPTIYLPTLAEEPGRNFTANRFVVDGPVPYDKLQRLRDRIVHRAPSEVLVLELKDDLREWAENVMLLAPV